MKGSCASRGYRGGWGDFGNRLYQTYCAVFGGPFCCFFYKHTEGSTGESPVLASCPPSTNAVGSIQILTNLAKDPALGYRCVVCVHAGGSGMIKQSTSRYSNASCSLPPPPPLPASKKKILHAPLALLPSVTAVQALSE